ncbi:MAG: SET domain-containing protein-lysine N-methyltransferase [Thermoprotei archaeon]
MDGGKHPKLRIGPAGPKGMGVFAEERIPPGTVIWDYIGEEQHVKSIPPDLLPYCFQVDYDVYIVPPTGSVGWYINHSCDPNCVIEGRTKIVSCRVIDVGEEATFDYSTDTGWDGFEMECLCGSRNCRKVITSFLRTDKRVRERYGKHVAPFLLSAETLHRRKPSV